MPLGVVGVCSLVNGGKEMSSVALLWGEEELGKPAEWLRASLPHGREVQVCTSLCWGGGPGSLYPGEGWGEGKMI